jgi:hypothetical protein
MNYFFLLSLGVLRLSYVFTTVVSKAPVTVLPYQ